MRVFRAVLCAVVLSLSLAVAVAPAVPAGAAPVVGGCPMFPADNVWNTDVSTLPVHARSSAWLASMNAGTARLHPDFGPSGGFPYGIPYTVVGSSQPKVGVSFDYDDESDAGPYPFGPATPIEGGPTADGDRHALMVDKDACTLYELYDAQYAAGGSTAGSGAIWNLRSNTLRPAGWTSADAAGLPVTAGLLRLDEVRAGRVDHAIRVTASRTDRSYIWPARHQAGAANDPSLPPMGARFRLKAGFDISGFRGDTQVVLRAMKRYGMLLADNGSNWYFQGSADDGWDTSMLGELKSVPASAFEAVDSASLMISPDSGQARQVAAAASGLGYRMAAADGGVFAFGASQMLGSMGGAALVRPVVGMASTVSGRGYWLVAGDGGMFAFGDAGFFGSMGGRALNSPIVGMAPTATRRGYWLVAADGGMFAFGDAGFYGSMGGVKLARPIVGMAPTPSGRGYWLVASDGGLFAFGDAGFYGSTAGWSLRAPIAGMRATKAGYWLVGRDGAVFAFGDAPHLGAVDHLTLRSPIVALG